MADNVRESGHDLNNHLSAILALADVERRRAHGPAASNLNGICESVRRAAASATVLAAGDRDLRYLRRLLAESDPVLLDLAGVCERDGIPAVEPETGRLLSVLIATAGASSVLELGTAYGYSALCLIRAMGPEGRVVTVDPDRDRTAIARTYFERAKVAGRIEIIERPAIEAMGGLNGRRFDAVFIDALKEEYLEYLRAALPLLRDGGLVIVDNLLWHHRASLRPAESDELSTKAIRTFNETFLTHPNLRATIVPVGDGVGIGVKTR